MQELVNSYLQFSTFTQVLLTEYNTRMAAKMGLKAYDKMLVRGVYTHSQHTHSMHACDCVLGCMAAKMGIEVARVNSFDITQCTLQHE